MRDEIRAMATFRTMNLLEPFSFPNPFDIIFCRNVAIYFTEADKTRLFRNLARYLARDGGLIIGSTESISGLCPDLEPKRYLRTVFYQWKGRHEGECMKSKSLAAEDSERYVPAGRRKMPIIEHASLAAAVEQAADGVVVTDISGNIQYVNPSFTAMTGYTSEEAVGKNPRLLKSGCHPAAFYKETLEHHPVRTGLAGRVD